MCKNKTITNIYTGKKTILQMTSDIVPSVMFHAHLQLLGDVQFKPPEAPVQYQHPSLQGHKVQTL